MGLDMYLDKFDEEGNQICEVAYWRKANQIREWFAQKLGEDEDGYVSGKVDREMLEELEETCKNVLENCPLILGKVRNGYRSTENGMEPIIENGKVMINVEYAEEHLPTSSGFFFGSTDYDEYYASDLEDTIKQIDTILQDTDFDTETIVYGESW